MTVTPNPSEPVLEVPVPGVPVLEVIVEGRHPQANLITEEDWQAWFSRWATQVDLPPSPLGAYELSVTLTDDGEIADLNGTYRQIDRPTDVLSFAALEDETPLAPELLETEPLYLGDIIISLDTAQRQAEAAGHSLTWEVVWLASHGFLHLLGWDHPDEAQLEAMLAKQGNLLQAIGWAAGWVDESTDGSTDGSTNESTNESTETLASGVD